jgi:hypothetical protein
LRKNLLFGLGGAGGGGGADAGGTVELGGGGVRGTFSAGIVDAVVGVAGVIGFELGDVATEPGGGGSDVAALAEPGRTTGFEFVIEALSAYPLYFYIKSACKFI